MMNSAGFSSLVVVSNELFASTSSALSDRKAPRLYFNYLGKLSIPSILDGHPYDCLCFVCLELVLFSYTCRDCFDPSVLGRG